MGRAVFVFTILVFSLSAMGALPNKIATVVVRKAQRSEVSQTLSYPAMVAARVHATILAEADGVVRKIHANLGQQVKNGGRLITVQQRDPIFQYAPVTTLAPVAGSVSELLVTEGALVVKGQKLMSVMNPNELKVTVEIPASDMSFLKPGLEGKLGNPGLPQPLTLKVAGLSPSVDPGTGTATAELAAVSKQDSQFLRPGMVGKISFRAGVHEGFLVPEDAVVMTQDKTFLRIVNAGKVKKVPVTLGNRMRGQVEINSGLEEGWQVVERASGFVADGEEVKVEEAKAESVN